MVLIDDRHAEPLSLQPYPDALLDDLPDTAPGPEARYEAKESVALAFVAGLQRLPARQRAVLVLRDVLGYPAAMAADMLGTSEVSVNSALQRARSTLAAQLPAASRDSAPAPAIGPRGPTQSSCWRTRRTSARR